MQSNRARRRLEWLSPKEEDQLNDEDDDDGEFEEEGAALVELIDHELVEIFRGVNFLLDEILVIGDADFGGRKLVEARCEHVTQELDGVVGMLGELHYF